VDEALRGRFKPPQLRMRGESGQIVSRIDPAPVTAHGLFEPPPFEERRGRRREGGSRRREARNWDAPLPLHPARGMIEGGTALRANQPLSVFPYGVSRSYLEQSVRDLRLPVRIQHHIEDADVVITLKNYYRRKDSPVRSAEANGIPIQVLRSNTVAQIKGALSRVYGVEQNDPADLALQEAIEAITRAQETGQEVELAPQNAYIRRLQHQLVEQHELAARSLGTEPNRRLVILGADEGS
jgi:hypothetical protein